MEVIDIIRDVMSSRLSPGIALQEIEHLIPEFFDNPVLLRHLRQGRRYLNRWICFEKRNKITDDDFLMVLRDTILFLGKFSVTPLIQNLVGQRGEDYGLYLETSGEVSAKVSVYGNDINYFFVRQCYGLEPFIQMEKPETAGDFLIHNATGYTSYKSFEQKVAIHTALSLPLGNTLLVTLSTGEGKSLVTQMCVYSNPGLTILVVPTVALGADQYRAAIQVLKNSVSSEKIFNFTGDQTENFIDLQNKLSHKEIRLLITSPEAIVKNTGLRKALTYAAESGYLSHLIIDEAHIVQDWGATFRPDFQFLSVIRRDLLQRSGNTLRTILLSATLTDDAIHQLQDFFSEKTDNQHSNFIPVRCDTLRTEIRYMVDPISRGENIEYVHRKKVLQYVRTLPKPMLIYTIQPGVAESWRSFLSENGIRNIATFTGLTPDDERLDIINRWNHDDLDIVVATSAFGMGIDKPDVRTVMHVTMPESINRFYQEVGRGGRDGWPSLSLLCYCPAIDHHQQTHISHRKIMTAEKMLKRWFIMSTDPRAERKADVIVLDTRKVPEYFTEKERELSGNRNRDWNLHTILFLVRHHFIEFEDMYFIPESGDYYVKVRMLDPDLMQDETKLNPLVQSFREEEYQATDKAFNLFFDMIRERDVCCFGERFSTLYTQADTDCGGCPQHNRERFLSSAYRLHNHVPPYQIKQIKRPYRIWHDSRCLLVNHVGDLDAEQMIKVATKLQEVGVTTWILPTNQELRNKSVLFHGMVISIEEAKILISKHRSLFGSGVLLSLGNNSRENQHMLDFGLHLLAKDIAVAFHMNINTICESYSRPMDQIVLCATLSERELLKLPDN